MFSGIWRGTRTLCLPILDLHLLNCLLPYSSIGLSNANIRRVVLEIGVIKQTYKQTLEYYYCISIVCINYVVYICY